MKQIGNNETQVFDWRRFSEYIPPEEYLRLLPQYTVKGVSDLQLFRDSLLRRLSHPYSDPIDALELGPGPGRATVVFLKTVPDSRLTVVDLSRRMTAFFSERFGEGVDTVIGDSLRYLKSTKREFDLIFSLWSFSHAVHQALVVDGRTKGTAMTEQVLERTLVKVLKKNGLLYIIHFDSTSDEQIISLRQRRRMWAFLKAGVPSPSQRIIEKFFTRAEKLGRCKFRRRRYVGDEILLGRLEYAREVYLKFHMEDIFGEVSSGNPVFEQLTEDLIGHCGSDGFVRVRPKWFEYSIEKI
jgi:SAM-dependent methyltransferase